MSSGRGPAERYLGKMLLEGLGGPRDMPRGIKLLESAYGKGQDEAASRIALAHELGEVVPPDPCLARLLYGRAAAMGHDLSRLEILRPAPAGCPEDEQVPATVR